MFPHTRYLADQLRGEQEAPIDYTRAERPATSDPRVLQLVMKKRYQTNLLRRMLEDAGYSDLAKMATIRRDRMEDYDNVD